MLRFSHRVVLGVLTAGFLFACGDKINPKRDRPIAVDGGELDGGGGPVVSYSQTIAPMVKASCAVSGCHNSSDKLLGFAFDTYDGLKKDVAAANDSIQAHSMPIPPGAELTDAQRKTFLDWVNQGALNN
jgi:hypothetical protein